MISTMINRPFMTLAPAWALDAISYSMMGALLPFFLTYVVAPARCCTPKESTVPAITTLD